MLYAYSAVNKYSSSMRHPVAFKIYAYGKRRECLINSVAPPVNFPIYGPEAKLAIMLKDLIFMNKMDS